MERKITNKELDIIFQNMTEREFALFIAQIPNNLKEFFIMRKALVKLFSDREYYEAVKSAICEKIMEDFFGKDEPQ